MRFITTAVLAGAAFIFTGCISSGSINTVNQTQVNLSQANYQVVATDVSGTSGAGYLFGLSGSGRGLPWTLALFRVDGEPMLVKQALENLWSNFEAEHGPVAGRNLALVNIQFDSDAANYLLLYSKLDVSVRADIVEFIGTE